MSFGEFIRQGKAQREANDPKAAAQTFTDAIPLATTDMQRREVYFYRALAYRAQGDMARALVDYDTMFAQKSTVFPVAQTGHLFRGCSFAMAKNYPKAQADYTQVMALLTKPDQANDFELYPVQQQDLTLAIEDCAMQISAEPSAEAYFCRGLVYRNLKQWEQAMADFDSALEYSPANTRLGDWAQTQHVVQYGIHSSHSRKNCPPGIDYCTLSYQMDYPQVIAYYFDRTKSRQQGPMSVDEGNALRTQLISEGWLLLKYASHKEGYDYEFFRIPSSKA